MRSFTEERRQTLTHRSSSSTIARPPLYSSSAASLSRQMTSSAPLFPALALTEFPEAFSTPTAGSCPPSACPDQMLRRTLDLVPRPGRRPCTPTISGFHLSSFCRASCSTSPTTCGKPLSTRRLTRSPPACAARRSPSTTTRVSSLLYTVCSTGHNLHDLSLNR